MGLHETVLKLEKVVPENMDYLFNTSFQGDEYALFREGFKLKIRDDSRLLVEADQQQTKDAVSKLLKLRDRAGKC